jgi:hypothetical protein
MSHDSADRASREAATAWAFSQRSHHDARGYRWVHPDEERVRAAPVHAGGFALGGNQIELVQIVLKVFERGAAYGPNSDLFRVGRGVRRWRSDHRRHRSQD